MCVCMQVVSFVQLFEIPWAVACLAPLSMGIPKQECWTGLPFPSEGHLPDLGIKPTLLLWEGGVLDTGPPSKPVDYFKYQIKV